MHLTSKEMPLMLENHDGYDWYWHSFTAHNAITNEEKAFFIEFFIINPSLKQDYPLFGKDGKPSYLMMKENVMNLISQSFGH